MKRLLLVTLFLLLSVIVKGQDYKTTQDSTTKVTSITISLIPVKEGFIVQGDTPLKGYLLLPMLIEAYSKEEIDYMVSYNQLVMASHAVKIKK